MMGREERKRRCEGREEKEKCTEERKGEEGEGQGILEKEKREEAEWV